MSSEKIALSLSIFYLTLSLLTENNGYNQIFRLEVYINSV